MATSQPGGLTCYEQKQLGADASPFDVMSLVFHSVGIWLVAFSALLFVCSPILYLHGDCILRTFAPNERNGIQVYLGWCLCWLLCAISPILGLLLVPVVIIIAFPILAKFEIFHLERAVFLCLPLPQGGPVVPISTYMFPVYAAKTAMDLYGVLTSKWKAPNELATYGPISVMVITDWLFMQAVDLYGDMGNLLSLWGTAPAWYVSAWASTMAGSISVIAFALTHKNMGDQTFLKIMLVQLLCEDIPQLALGVASICSSNLSQEVNQYLIYALVGNTIACIALAKNTCSHMSRSKGYSDMTSSCLCAA